MFRSLFILILVLGFAAPVAADWNPGDPFKMHYPQLPDPMGWDVNATWPKVIADDWLCIESGAVTDIHFWGSWREDLVSPISNIHLSIHANIPEGPDGWSIPGELLWERDFQPGEWSERHYGDGLQGWYDPNTGDWNWPDHFMYYQYNVEDIVEPFFQDEGTIYWLDISATVEDPVAQWGWKTSIDHFMDDAVWSDFGGSQTWTELRDPMTGDSLDMAFVIVPGPGGILLFAAGLGACARRRRRT